jgi:SAM-dependent methyltransferase
MRGADTVWGSAQKADAGIKLHLGAFDCAVEGWLNTDVTPHIFISKIPGAAELLRAVGKLDDKKYEMHRSGQFRALTYVDLTRNLPFSDASVAAVFSSHVFEHLFPDEIRRLVVEVHRVLVSGGVCRVVVPDLEKVVALYDREAPERFLSSMFEADTRDAVKNGHHWGFTGASLKKLFADCGFATADVVSFREGQCPDLGVLDNRPEESLFFEAVK